MGFAEPALHESDDEVIAHVLAPTGLDFASSRRAARSGRSPSPRSSSPTCASRRRAGGSSSRASAAQADGLPRVPQPHADTRPRDGRLRLLSPALAWILNDTLRQRSEAHAAGSAAPRSRCTRTTPRNAASPPATRDPAQRRRASCADGRALRRPAAGRRLLAQGPLAQARVRRRERQRAQPRRARATWAAAPRCTGSRSPSLRLDLPLRHRLDLIESAPFSLGAEEARPRRSRPAATSTITATPLPPTIR